MSERKRSLLIRAARQMIYLVAVAGFMGIGTNYLFGGRIPLIGEWSAQARFAQSAGQSPVIDTAQARRLAAAGDALFVDARPPAQYVEGHIRSALSLPWQDVDRRLMEVADRLERTKTIIVYCDGEDCDLGQELTLFLKEMHYADVRILLNGWREWQAAGLPTAKGDKP